MPYKYRYSKRAVRKIRTFYRNVALKYRHAYSYEDMEATYAMPSFASMP